MSQQSATAQWVYSEGQTLQHLLANVQDNFKRLRKKASPGRIHKTRVALRHFFSLMSVLEQEGWSTARFDKHVAKLNVLKKRLGKIRDLDVALNTIAQIGGDQRLEKSFKSQRKQALAKLEADIKELPLKKTVRSMRKYTERRTAKVADAVGRSALADQTPKEHFSAVLRNHEQEVRKLALAPSSAEDFHLLRLSVKKWRYLLEDLCHAKEHNLDVAQAKLGELHDLDNLRGLITEDDDLVFVTNLNARRELLLQECRELIKKLPFGYRPYLGSRAS